MGPEIFLLICLQLKHWFIDFVNQSQIEIQSKSVYGHRAGINHSLKHGLGTFLAVWMTLGLPGLILALLMGLVDSILHYHIDYTKVKFGCRNINQKEFWSHFGLDQFAHQLTYIMILGITLL